MKPGKLPPNYSPEMCPFDALEPDDYVPLYEYKGSCPNCTTGQFPNQFLVIYVRDDGIYHVFRTMEEVRCMGCGVMVEYVSVLCHLAKVDVTGEFGELRK